MLIDHFNDCAQRLHCTDVERDACLETAAALLHFWTDVRQNGPLFIGGSRAEQDPNPFFRACLLDAIDLIWTDEEPLLENLYVQYLAAGDYHGADFLQNVVIAKGILTFLKFLHEHEDGGSYRQWGDRLSVAVGGYFGVEYREKFRKTLLREIRKRERDAAKVSFLPEFDALMELPLPLCGKLLQDIPGDITLALEGALSWERLNACPQVLCIVNTRKSAQTVFLFISQERVIKGNARDLLDLRKGQFEDWVPVLLQTGP